MKLINYITTTSYMAVIMFLCNISNIHSMHDSQLGNQLCKAAEKNNIVKVKELLNQGVDPNYFQDIFKGIPLFHAIAKGNSEVVQILIDAGADVNKRELFNDDSPLHSAVSKKNLAVVQILIKAGAVVNVTDKFGVTPMRYAAFKNRIAIGKELLQHGAHLEGTSEEWKKKLTDN